MENNIKINKTRSSVLKAVAKYKKRIYATEEGRTLLINRAKEYQRTHYIKKLDPCEMATKNIRFLFKK